MKKSPTISQPARNSASLADSAAELLAQFFCRSPLLGQLEERIRQTANHLAAQLVKAGVFSEQEADALRLAAAWQDAGLLALPAELLLKASPLTLAEKKLLETHVEESCCLAAQAGLPQTAVDFIAAHHEQAAGGGYPQGLRGEEIPTGAQLLRLTGDYCLLQLDLPHRSGVRSYCALELLAEQQGKKYSPKVFQQIFLPALGDFDWNL